MRRITSIVGHPLVKEVKPGSVHAPGIAGVAWGNSAPLALAAFAVTTFMLSMINAGLVNAGAAVPTAQVGHALGLFLYGFGIFTVWIWVASFRSNVVALAALAATFFLLAAGNYDGTTGLVHAGGWLGLAVAAFAAYLSCAELCEASYKRSVLPVWPLARRH